MHSGTFEDKHGNPSEFYESPTDVLRDQELSRDEKRRVLKSMEVDAELMADATAENMAGGEKGPSLRDIHAALRTLETENAR